MSPSPKQKAAATPTLPTLHDRASGILLHPTSLPGPYGCGDLGPQAHTFAERLATASQRWWQMLPVGPLGYGNSPYSAHSAFAGSPLLVSPDLLAAQGFLKEAELTAGPALPREHVDYARTAALRERLLRKAFETWRGQGKAKRKGFDAWTKEHAVWLDDFALFSSVKRAHGDVRWADWPAPLRDRQAVALREARKTFEDELLYHRYVQWQFAVQWAALRERCAELGVALLGDLPIFVAHDSADVWANPDLFKLDKRGECTSVAGVPPDYFSATGQRWGNPIYRWDRLRKTGYRWWIDRLRATLERFDAIRLDHFIGFERFWEIPASCPTAVEGKWRPGPSAHFFATVKRKLGGLPLLAEDLGAVTPAVKALRDGFELPGIRILQFAFGTDPSAPDFLPHNYTRNCAVYTGTHDNDTTAGWFHDRGGGHSTRAPAEAEAERQAAMDYLGVTDRDEIHWAMIRGVLASIGNLALLPLQDVLGLGSDARMNRPGEGHGNWEWRVTDTQLTDEVLERLGRMSRTYGRGQS
jgi:4-alpha-glucanotransferase